MKKKIKTELTALLNNNRMYPISEIRKKFKDTFPSVKEILGLESDGSTSMISIDKAPRNPRKGVRSLSHSPPTTSLLALHTNTLPTKA